MAYVYLIGVVGARAVKIGYSADPDDRLRHLQKGSHMPLVVLWKEETADCEAMESMLHRHFDSKWLLGEWFDLGADPVGTIREVFPRFAEEIARNSRESTVRAPDFSSLSSEDKIRLAMAILALKGDR